MNTHGAGARVRNGLLNALAVAVALTALNALKPLHIDDVVPWYYANHLLEDPYDLYDFEILWQQIPQSAHSPIAPPVLPYWWAAGLRLFGQNELMWKVWLFPFNLALTVGLWSIFRRFARGLEGPLLWLAVISPTVLPSLNLIIEVPGFALSVAATALFIRASDRRSARGAVLAGLVCALAIQTKWTSLVTPAVFLAYALIRGRLTLGVLAAGVAGLSAASWEGYVALINGSSHFVYQLGINNPAREGKAQLVMPLITDVGGTAAAVALVGLAGLGARRRGFRVAALGVVTAYALLALDPSGSIADIRNPLTGKPWSPRIDTPLFLALGAFVGLVMTAVLWRAVRPLSAVRSWRKPRRRDGWFLVAWLALELAGYFALSPFGAVRRVIPTVLVLTIVAGWLASLTCRTPERRALVRWAVVLGVLLGLLYEAADVYEARAAERGASEAVEWVHARDPGATPWFSAFWGFEYYATEAGLRPAIPSRSRLAPGDWLLTMDVKGIVSSERYRIDPAVLKLEETLALGDTFPYTTVPCFYIGRRPLERQAGPRLYVKVYRVLSEFTPVTLPGQPGYREPAASSQ